MPSNSLENAPIGTRSTADRLLMLLKTDGPQTTAALAAAIGATGEAARQQLAKLEAGGLVASRSEVRGAGRPAHVWELTGSSNARFPDAHADLTVQLIAAVRTELGEQALETIVSARERTMRRAYAAELDGVVHLDERVARLTAIRTREGYMATCERDGNDFVLVENHCPICAAAAACQGFCRAELELFQATLGPGVTVQRFDHIMAGARRCAYRISPVAPGEQQAPDPGGHESGGQQAGAFIRRS